MPAHPEDELLADLAADVLPLDVARQVEAHVMACARCFQVLSDAESVRTLLRQSPPEAMPPQVLARLDQAFAAVRQGQEPRPMPRRAAGQGANPQAMNPQAANPRAASPRGAHPQTGPQTQRPHQNPQQNPAARQQGPQPRQTQQPRQPQQPGQPQGPEPGRRLAQNPAAHNPGVQNPAAPNPAALNPGVQNPAAHNPGAQNPAARNPMAAQNPMAPRNPAAAQNPQGPQNSQSPQSPQTPLDDQTRQMRPVPSGEQNTSSYRVRPLKRTESEPAYPADGPTALHPAVRDDTPDPELTQPVRKRRRAAAPSNTSAMTQVTQVMRPVRDKGPTKLARMDSTQAIRVRRQAMEEQKADEPSRWPKISPQLAAAAVLVMALVGGGVTWTLQRGGSAGSEDSGGASTSSAAPVLTTVQESGTQYQKSDLDGQISALVKERNETLSADPGAGSADSGAQSQDQPMSAAGEGGPSAVTEEESAASGGAPNGDLLKSPDRLEAGLKAFGGLEQVPRRPSGLPRGDRPERRPAGRRGPGDVRRP